MVEYLNVEKRERGGQGARSFFTNRRWKFISERVTFKSRISMLMKCSINQAVEGELIALFLSMARERRAHTARK